MLVEALMWCVFTPVTMLTSRQSLVQKTCVQPKLYSLLWAAGGMYSNWILCQLCSWMLSDQWLQSGQWHLPAMKAAAPQAVGQQHAAGLAAPAAPGCLCAAVFEAPVMNIE